MPAKHVRFSFTVGVKRHIEVYASVVKLGCGARLCVNVKVAVSIMKVLSEGIASI